MDFFLYIKYFKTISEVFRFFHLMRLFRKDFQRILQDSIISNVGHYKEEFECSFHSRKYW